MGESGGGKWFFTLLVLVHSGVFAQTMLCHCIQDIRGMRISENWGGLFVCLSITRHIYTRYKNQSKGQAKDVGRNVRFFLRVEMPVWSTGRWARAGVALLDVESLFSNKRMSWFEV